MPKATKKQKNPDDDEILKEIAETLKSNKRGKNESEEAEDAETLESPDINTGNVGGFNFSSFMNPAETGGPGKDVPVLERVIGSQAAGPGFVRQSDDETMGSPRNERDEIRYEAGVATENAPLYSAGASASEPEYEPILNVEPPVLRARDFSNEARTTFLDRSAAFIGAPQERLNSEPEKFQAQTFQSESGLPFETEERKYREVRPSRRNQ